MFSERLARRKRLWWRSSEDSKTFIEHLRRLEMLHVTVRHDAPVTRWHRGKYWQRRLLNKLNAKEFAIKMGCSVPQTYWHGRLLRPATLSSLPEYFVLKPVLGAVSKGVYVIAGSRDLLSDMGMTREQLYQKLCGTRGRFSHIPLLAEEFVTREAGRYVLPIEYKFYVFEDIIGAIEVVHRSADPESPTCNRFYTPDWRPLPDRIQTRHPIAEVSDPPHCLDQMIDTARKLGRAFESFVRVDLYAGEGGCVFGEFSSIPYNGRQYTPYAENLFESLWQENIPDKI